MKMTKVYLSGRISGLSRQSYVLNFRRAELLMFQKYAFAKVYNPTKITPFLFIRAYWFHMAADIYYLIKCDDVYFMKNWTQSKGARLEHKIAIKLKKRIIYELSTSSIGNFESEPDTNINPES